MVISLFTVIPFEVSAADAVEYICRSWDSESKTVVSSTQTCTDYKDLAQRGSNVLSGFYVVRSSMSVGDWLTVPDNGSASIILCDGATLTLSDGISVAESGSLTIYGQNRNTGKLYCHHENSNGALIGGYGNSGDITIHGGTLDLYTFYGAACIGGGEGGSPNIVTIYGGTIKCKGGSGACIGGGKYGEASHYNGEGIRIYGGTLDLDGSTGSCIGGGVEHDGSTGSVAIYGGTITGSSKIGAVIGGGYEGQGPQIDIYGGTVTAVASHANYTGAAIGSGSNAHQIAPINIHDGVIFAVSISGAGIGAGYDRSSRNINITGGTIVATSTGGGAGIGGGRNGSGENISISNPNVVATAQNYNNGDEYFNLISKALDAIPNPKAVKEAVGKAAVALSGLLAKCFGEHYSGAGIGGGEGGGFNIITINNSTVNATAGGYAAGIGSGDEAENCGKINIINSTVTATGGSEGAGIGTGNDTDTTADITISYSKVEAYGGWLGAGIGGEDGDGGTIRITASDVLAWGAFEGAGIGGGEDGDGGNITIERSTVWASAGSDGNPVAVGKGNGGSSHGSLTLGDGVYVLHDSSRFEGSSAVSACRYYRSVSIRYSCNHNNKKYVSCDDTEHSIFCNDCGMYWGRGEHVGAARYVNDKYHEVY